MRKHLKLILIVSTLVTATSLSSCVPLAAGAAGGYLYSEAQE